MNLEERTVEGFGKEWRAYNQTAPQTSELKEIFERYFSVFPWEALPSDAEGFDLGCGSGRWARFVAARVRRLHCIDASAEALAVAQMNLRKTNNCQFHHASVGHLPFEPGSMDFGYSLGVLHHVPDTQAGIQSCVDLLKPGAPLLLYLYYAFDQRPFWFRTLWRMTDLGRRVISRLPFGLKRVVTELIALVVYFPLARAAKLLEKLGAPVDGFPLSGYRHQSFYTMRTDALDRFGTRLEQRYTARQIKVMMEKAGLKDIAFRSDAPYWCAVGRKA